MIMINLVIHVHTCYWIYFFVRLIESLLNQRNKKSTNFIYAYMRIPNNYISLSISFSASQRVMLIFLSGVPTLGLRYKLIYIFHFILYTRSLHSYSRVNNSLVIDFFQALITNKFYFLFVYLNFQINNCISILIK